MVDLDELKQKRYYPGFMIKNEWGNHIFLQRLPSKVIASRRCIWDSVDKKEVPLEPTMEDDVTYVWNTAEQLEEEHQSYENVIESYVK